MVCTTQPVITVSQAQTGRATAHNGKMGSGDEAGGTPQKLWLNPSSYPSPASTTPHSPLPSPTSSEFAEQEAQLRRLLCESHETIFPERGSTSTPSALTALPPPSAAAGVVPEGAELPSQSIVKNLDTGETRDLLRDDLGESFFGHWRSFSGRRNAPAWSGWWQEQRKRNEELWRVAEAGNLQQLLAILGDPVASASRSSSTRAPSSTVSTMEAGCPRPQIESRSLHGRTALHIAASKGHAECVRALLGFGAEKDARTDARFTSLHVAAQRGHLAVVQVLLEVGCDAGAKTRQDELALHLAAAKGHTEVLEFLLQNTSADFLWLRNSYGQRPAEVSADIKTMQLFQSVLCVRPAVSSEHSEIEEARQDSYAGRTPYHQGSVLLRNSRADAVRRLLEATGAMAPGSKRPARPASRHCGGNAAGSSSSKGGLGIVGAGTAATAGGGDLQQRSKSERTLLSAAKDSKGSEQPLPGNKMQRRQQSFTRLRAEGVEVVGPDTFHLLAILGRGSFGEVYHVMHKKSGQEYAMKVLRKSKIIGRNLVRYAMTERNLLSYIRHPNIVRLHFAFQTPSSLVLVLQFCSGGTLASLIAQEGRFSEELAQFYTAEIFLAIEHLHERQVVYRDLKPDNVVMDEGRHAILTDFGLSKEGIELGRGTKSFCGSVAYLAPEILSRSGHGLLVDLYGIGVLLFEMLVGHPPYYSRDRDTLFRNIATASLAVPSHVSPRASSLITGLMQRVPAQRLGAHCRSEVREHLFFQGLDFGKVLRRELAVPQLRRTRASSKDHSPGDGGVGKTPPHSPFEGRFEAQVRRTWSSSSQDIAGWEFATPSELVPCPSPRTGSAALLPEKGYGARACASPKAGGAHGRGYPAAPPFF